MRIYSIIDTTEIYTKNKLVCLDRDWFKDGNIIYYNGIHPIHIIGYPSPHISNTGWWYRIEEWMTFKAGDWFTLEKQEEVKQPKFTITINIW
jgi:hypothetical protein